MAKSKDTAFQGDPDFVREGRVTDQGMGEFRARMPFADLGAFEKDRRLSAMSVLFTVSLVARYVAWKLGQARPQQGPSPLLHA